MLHQAQNGSHFENAPPIFSFLNFKDFRNFKDFCKNSNLHIFLIFEDIHSPFCTVSHDNDLIKWCDFHKNRTCVSPVLGCGSLRPPQESITAQYPRTDRVKLFSRSKPLSIERLNNIEDVWGTFKLRTK